MSLDDGSADIIRFDCDACGREHSLRALRKCHGSCTKCRGEQWSMTTVYQEGERSTELLPLLLYAVFGIKVLKEQTETIQLVTPALPADEALQIANAPFSKRGRMAFQYMELRRQLDGQRDREKLREQGGRNCATCGVFFMPTADKLWTLSGCCSKACLAQHPTGHEPQFVASQPPLAEVKKVASTVSVTCSQGHVFTVPKMYRGTARPCPTCHEKTLVS